MPSRIPTSLVAFVLLAGCLPDTAQFDVATDDGRRDGGSTDAAPTDAAPTDGTMPDLGPPEPDPCLPDPTCEGGCPMPWLLAAIEDLPGGQDCGGRILRLSLTNTDAACICTGYDAAGSLPAQPFGVGFSPPNTVVTAIEDGSAIAIDATNDRIVWEESISGQPADIFAIEDTAGSPMIAVATRMRGISNIREVRFFDASTGGAPILRTTNGDLPLGLGVVSMTQSSIDPQFFRALDVNNYAAAEVNPWTDTRVEPYYTAARSGRFLSSVYAAHVGDRHRTVWTGTRTDLTGSPSRIWDLGVSDATGDQRLPTGNWCDKYDDGLDYDVECDFLHAVPDPTVFNQKIALCDYPGGRRITRVRAVDRCLDIIEQSALFDSARIARLGLALPTYWAP